MAAGRTRRPASGAAQLLSLAGLAWSLCFVQCSCQDRDSPLEQPALDLSVERAREGWTVVAVEYARSQGVPVSRLVRGAPARATVDMSWMFHVVVGRERVLLVDTGTDDFVEHPHGRRARYWKIDRARSVEEALARLGLEPGDVTDVFVSHHHWDHADGMRLFPQARHYFPAGEVQRLGAASRQHLRRLEQRGQLVLLGPQPQSILPQVQSRQAGRHTAHHHLVVVTCAGGQLLALGGDGAYLFQNLEQGVPITQTKAPRHNVREMQSLVEELGAGAVLPGHDPSVFTRFAPLGPSPAPLALARLCR